MQTRIEQAWVMISVAGGPDIADILVDRQLQRYGHLREFFLDRLVLLLGVDFARSLRGETSLGFIGNGDRGSQEAEGLEDLSKSMRQL